MKTQNPEMTSDPRKKPYQAPALVVLGNAGDLTQMGTGAATDATIAFTAIVS